MLKHTVRLKTANETQRTLPTVLTVILSTIKCRAQVQGNMVCSQTVREGATVPLLRWKPSQWRVAIGNGHLHTYTVLCREQQLDPNVL